MMGCPGAGRHEQDQWMGEFFAAGPAYTYDGTRIDLSTEKVTMAFATREVVDPDRPLAGTAWQITHVTFGPAPGAAADANASTSASFVPAGSTLLFTANTVQGNAGCVEFSGPAARAGDTVTFGELEADRSGCGKDADTTAADGVLTVLNGPVGVDVEAAGLNLTHPSGRGLQLHTDA